MWRPAHRLRSNPADPNRGKLTLSRVMTVSGAAVDPNMSGLSPPLMALMTLFPFVFDHDADVTVPKR